MWSSVVSHLHSAALTLKSPPSVDYGCGRSEVVEVESLMGHPPFLLVRQIGTEGKSPPVGLEAVLELLVNDDAEMLVYSGKWEGQNATTSGLPVLLLHISDVHNSAKPYPRCLRCSIDNQTDAAIINDSRDPDYSNVGRAQQLLLRGRVIQASEIHNPGRGEVRAFLRIGSDHWSSNPISPNSEMVYVWDEDFTLLISGHSPENFPYLEIQLQSANGPITDVYTHQVANMEPCVEATLQCYLSPSGSLQLLIELTALERRSLKTPSLSSLNQNAPVENTSQLPNMIRSGWLLKLQKKKFGLYHKRWFELRDSHIYYYDSSSADVCGPKRCIDVNNLSISLNGDIMTLATVSDRYVLKSTQQDIQDWYKDIQQAQEFCRLRQARLAARVKSILRKDVPALVPSRKKSKSVTIKT